MRSHGTPSGVIARRVKGTSRQPGILACGSTYPLSRLPALESAVAADDRLLKAELPAYSGGTAWALHPLRVAAGSGLRVLQPSPVERAVYIARIVCLHSPLRGSYRETPKPRRRPKCIATIAKARIGKLIDDFVQLGRIRLSSPPGVQFHVGRRRFNQRSA